MLRAAVVPEVAAVSVHSAEAGRPGEAAAWRSPLCARIDKVQKMQCVQDEHTGTKQRQPHGFQRLNAQSHIFQRVNMRVHRPAAGGAPGGGGGLAIAAVRANFSDYSKKKKKVQYELHEYTATKQCHCHGM